MKLGKKTTAILAFSVGTVIFATSALADVAIGSGYNSMKNAAKETMARLTKDVDSFSADMKISAKLDGKEFVRDSGSTKVDMKNKREEAISEQLRDDGTTDTCYNYSEPTMEVRKYGEEELYRVYKHAERRYEPFTNPFEEEFAQDAEKVVDAFVGSLSDIIQMEETDGKTMYIGNLTETQVPMLVNALTSFVVKYSVMNDHRFREMKLPSIENDFCVRSASGKAIQDESGLLTDVLGTITLAGTDKDGQEHELTAELSMSLFDINATVVTAPELTDENSEVFEEKSEIDGSIIFDGHVGVYKNDIVETKDRRSFAKVGERVLEITEAGDGVCSGRYYEVYHDDYTPDKAIRSFTFVKGKKNEKNTMYGEVLRCTNESGEEFVSILRPSGYWGQNMNLILDVEFEEDGRGYSHTEKVEYDSEFIRVFE